MTNIVNNDGVGISEMITPPNTGDVTASGQIRDALDFPHSGVFKALYSTAIGRYATKNGAAGSMGFNCTYSGGTSPQVTVAAGYIIRDGKRTLIAQLSNHALTRPTSGHFYHLVVVQDDDTLDVNISSTVDDIPDLGDDEIPIALIKVAHDANTSTASLPTQFFTSNKIQQRFSVGYGDSNAYAEAMSIEGNATRTTFFNKVADADIRFILADNTADEVFEIVTDDDADGNLTPATTKFSVDGTGATTIAGALTLSTIANATGNFLVKDSGVVKKEVPQKHYRI